MVFQVGLAKFYGNSLPRPQIYEDVKCNEERVDPPTPPSAPILSWAREATWSMGGLASKRRKRSQGKIEGSLRKLRDLQDDDDDDGNAQEDPIPKDLNPKDSISKDSNPKDSNPSSTDSAPATEGLIGSEEECSSEAVRGVRTRSEKLKIGVSSTCEESDAVSRRASPTRGSRGRRKHRRNRG